MSFDEDFEGVLLFVGEAVPLALAVDHEQKTAPLLLVEVVDHTHAAALATLFRRSPELARPARPRNDRTEPGVVDQGRLERPIPLIGK